MPAQSGWKESCEKFDNELVVKYILFTDLVIILTKSAIENKDKQSI